MAVIKDRKVIYQEQIDSLEHQKQLILAKMEKFQSTPDEGIILNEAILWTDLYLIAAMDVDSDLPNSLDELKLKLQSNESEIRSLQQKIEAEKEKFKNWKAENIRRKHNYIPFFVNLLKILADKGQLVPLVQAAQKKK
jgi:ubiquitin carboxyl-terminal hydrolase L5